MIKIISESKKVYRIYNDDTLILELILNSSAITNKYYIICEFINDLSNTLGNEFDIWFINFLKKYSEKEDENHRFNLLLENVNEIKLMVDTYKQKKNFDYSLFSKKEKIKNSIFFEISEIEDLITTSNYLKLYCIIFNSDNLCLKNNKNHKDIYNKLVEEILKKNVVYKIFQIIKTKTYRCSVTDKYILDYIKKIQGKELDDHIISIFNFIMSNMMILCANNRNPITYLVTIIDECLKWLVRKTFKDIIVYNDTMSTEDMQSININNLKTYSYNNTLTQLTSIAQEKLYNKLDGDSNFNDIINCNINDSILDFEEKSKHIMFRSPVVDFLVFPILSESLNIPYKFFNSLGTKRCAVISLYFHDILKKVFNDKYEDLFSLLDYYPKNKPPIHSTYRLSKTVYYINKRNEVQNTFGFKTRVPLHDMLSTFVGKLSRVEFVSILDNKTIKKPSLIGIEPDIIDFYCYYFSGSFKSEIERIKLIILNDF